jgi:hypothetical protein
VGSLASGLLPFVFRRLLFVRFPKAVFCKKRNQARTANGLIVTGAISLLAAAAWFGYAAIHVALPPILQG